MSLFITFSHCLKQCIVHTLSAGHCWINYVEALVHVTFEGHLGYAIYAIKPILYNASTHVHIYVIFVLVARSMASLDNPGITTIAKLAVKSL